MDPRRCVLILSQLTIIIMLIQETNTNLLYKIIERKLNSKGIDNQENEINLQVQSEDDFNESIDGSEDVEERLAVSQNKLWKDGVVPYEFDVDFNADHKLYIRYYMVELSYLSCVSFIPRSKETVFLHITSKSKSGNPCCSADVGIQRSKSLMTMTPECFTPRIIRHELMHVLGFHHEHCRADRDDHVKINKENIKPGYENAFEIMKNLKYDNEYDFQSIMHYYSMEAADEVSKGPVIQPIDVKVRMRIEQQERLSAMDARQLNGLYKCYSKLLPKDACYNKKGCKKLYDLNYCTDKSKKDFMAAHCGRICGFCKKVIKYEDYHRHCKTAYQQKEYCKHYRQVSWHYCKKTCEYYSECESIKLGRVRIHDMFTKEEDECEEVPKMQKPEPVIVRGTLYTGRARDTGRARAS